MIIRQFEPKDAQNILDVYNYYIENTAFTFDIRPHTLSECAEWFSGFEKTYPCFVALQDGKLIGYACADEFCKKAAYASSVEVSVYLAPNNKAQGVGTNLYKALFPNLNQFHRAYAGITQPNLASVALHNKFGFISVGTFSQVGYKFDRYWDVIWYEKQLT